jgi:nicotinamide mononucleotide transporter
MKQTGWVEYVAVFSGIASVWFSRKENILVYPVGLINTSFYIYLSAKAGLYGEASVNLYYTIMSIYGWIVWARRTPQHQNLVKIKHSDRRWIAYQLIFFLSFYLVIFQILTHLPKEFSPGVIPGADAFAASTAFTGMWLMTRKKVESWYWWMATNVASIPLYFVKEYVFTSVYYLILLVFSFWGLAEWRKRANKGYN